MDEQFKKKILDVYRGEVDSLYWDKYFQDKQFKPVLLFNEPGNWESRVELDIGGVGFEDNFLEAYLSGCNISIVSSSGINNEQLRVLRKIGLLKGICTVNNSVEDVCDFGSVTYHWSQEDETKNLSVINVVKGLLVARELYQGFAPLYLNSKFRSVDLFLNNSAPLLDPLIMLNNCSHRGEYIESFVNFFLVGSTKTAVNILGGVVNPIVSIDKVFDLLLHSVREEELYRFTNQRYELRGFYNGLERKSGESSD